MATPAPHYFPVGEHKLSEFIRQLVLELPLPLYLYNMPVMTKTQFEPETLSRLAQLEGIIGVKENSGDLNYSQQVVEVAKARPDWRLFMGPEHLLVDALRLSGHGGVNGGALVDPGLLVNLYEAAVNRDEARVLGLQARLLRLGEIHRADSHASAGQGHEMRVGVDGHLQRHPSRTDDALRPIRAKAYWGHAQGPRAASCARPSARGNRLRWSGTGLWLIWCQGEVWKWRIRRLSRSPRG